MWSFEYGALSQLPVSKLDLKAFDKAVFGYNQMWIEPNKGLTITTSIELKLI